MTANQLTANQLRESFVRFFSERGHERVPSASLVPSDPSVLFTIAGMVPFKPYFLGEQTPPWPRAVSVQKCFRTVDIDVVGKSRRHGTFFEMLGNFSFGDYFKAQAIPFAWELVTEVLGIEKDRLWITVHESDDEAQEIWIDVASVSPQRIQRMGEDNFWRMGDTGPCGPSSEIYLDMRPSDPRGAGPAGDDPERYVEIWNLVFMQNNRLADGTLGDLPQKNIDTGAGLERILPILQGTDSIFATDVLAPLVESAQQITGVTYGAEERSDVALRIMADHGRAMTMLVSDGVLPSNDGRGYVLRRLIRRAVLAARRLGVEAVVTPRLAATATEVMGVAYPKLRDDLDLVQAVVEREEKGFDRTLRTGLSLLEEALDEARAEGSNQVAGTVAFRLHDTHGFPIELTEELSSEAGLRVDREGYEEQMAAQRQRARQAAKVPAAAEEGAYRELLDSEGPTSFVGRSPADYSTPARIVAVLGGASPETAEVFLDRTPFYAEGGGQVGDTGSIVTETGRAEVFDTVVALPGLTVHRCKVEGELFAGEDALATIDGPRREALRRNHTGTHLLHAALRSVLGDHVRQQGSLVAPDRLRFDFSHHGALSSEELDEILALTNADVLTDDDVTTTEMTLAQAQAMGAVAFFGEKYGERVRVVRAGRHSMELCGGTHVDALGQIGPISLLSEGSIGANTRRIEAVTGEVSLERFTQRNALLEEAARLLRTEPDEVLDALQKVLDRQRSTERELQQLRGSALEGESARMAASALDGVVTARVDGRGADELRALAVSVLRHNGVRAVVLAGSPDGTKVSIAAATGGDPDASALVKNLGSLVGGSGGGSREVAVAGGRQVDGIDDALAEARRVLAGE